MSFSQITVEKKVGTGDAKEVICGAVEKLGADILVMGSHDYGFFKRYTCTVHTTSCTFLYVMNSCSLMFSFTWSKLSLGVVRLQSSAGKREWPLCQECQMPCGGGQAPKRLRPKLLVTSIGTMMGALVSVCSISVALVG